MTNLDYLRQVGKMGFPVLVALLPKDAAELSKQIDAMHTELEYLRGERDAVVAYLRTLAAASGQSDLFSQGSAAGNEYAAQMIERGEHRREGEK